MQLFYYKLHLGSGEHGLWFTRKLFITLPVKLGGVQGIVIEVKISIDKPTTLPDLANLVQMVCYIM